TRFSRDWSSDVCSSDLILNAETREPAAFRRALMVAEYAVQHLRDRDVLQLFAVSSIDDIPTHYHDRSIDTPKAWGTQLKEIAVRSEERRAGKERRARRP